MLKKVLVANRGEIAMRVARACRELGIASVAVYSTADADSAVVRYADEAVQIGPGPSKGSYLNIPNVVEAARKTGADAVHPGYGFLSEDADFAEVCAENGLIFVGPPAEVMRRAGDKTAMRRCMAAAGVPVLPGSDDALTTVAEAEEVAAEIGYPVVIKAVAGGGGRGITAVHSRGELQVAFAETTAQARLLFGNGEVYLERYVRHARHVEVQILRDGAGTTVHLGERDCSLQRRRQKLVEEAPSPTLDEEQRRRLTGYAIRGADAIAYLGAGTMEFLVHDSGDITFMELNARIQVEHPVSEMVTGIDIVREQLRIAAGLPLSFTQQDVVLRGAAIECRINAEDPMSGFRPTPGRLDVLQPAGGPFTRVDSGFQQGDTIPPHYDSLIAKLIVWAPDRAAAITRMTRALDEFRVAGPGVCTTIGLARRLVNAPLFVAAGHTTTTADEQLAQWQAAS